MITCENIGDIWLDATKRQGRITAFENELLELFGQPEVVCDDQREWALRFLLDDGRVVYATIYPTPLTPGCYDVGGYSADALYIVTQFLTGVVAEVA
jgi:hypothetical protein